MLHQYKLTLLPILQHGKYGQGPKSVYFFFISIVSTPANWTLQTFLQLGHWLCHFNVIWWLAHVVNLDLVNFRNWDNISWTIFTLTISHWFLIFKFNSFCSLMSWEVNCQARLIINLWKYNIIVNFSIIIYCLSFIVSLIQLPRKQMYITCFYVVCAKIISWLR